MSQAFAPNIDGKHNLCIQLDGKLIGWARPSVAQQLATSLRIWKTQGDHGVPLDLEIGYVPMSKGGQYPGLFLFSARARMMRPVLYLANGRDDQVGSFEQVYMNIACLPSEIEEGVSTHVEHSPTNFLSILANLTPFSDFNQVIPMQAQGLCILTDTLLQSPRNIYQCQVLDKLSEMI
jgi:DNA-directed RNA polymerase I subunit RPA2